MLKQKMKLLSIAALALSASLSAQAHQIWIEQDAASARLYLGEFADNLRETSPGMLDKFSQTSARLLTAQGERPVQLSKQATAFALSARAGAAESLLAQESGYPSWEQGDKAQRHIWTPAARWVPDFGARAPVLSLDLVPTGKPGEFQVFFQNQPLAGAKVEVVAASGWSRELKADQGGRFSVSLPWRGAYALEVQHSDKNGGERAGQKFDVGLYVTTLSFNLADGLESPPAPVAPGANK